MATLEKAFGAALKQERVKRKLTQAQLAELSDLDITYISLLERGGRQPTLKVFLKLAEAMGASPTRMLSSTLKKYKS